MAGNFWNFQTVIKLHQIYDYLQKSQLNSKERERISDAQKYIKWTLAFINVVLIVLIGVLINCKYKNAQLTKNSSNQVKIFLYLQYFQNINLSLKLKFNVQEVWINVHILNSNMEMDFVMMI